MNDIKRIILGVGQCGIGTAAGLPVGGVFMLAMSDRFLKYPMSVGIPIICASTLLVSPLAIISAGYLLLGMRNVVRGLSEIVFKTTNEANRGRQLFCLGSAVNFTVVGAVALTRLPMLMRCPRYARFANPVTFVSGCFCLPIVISGLVCAFKGSSIIFDNLLKKVEE